MDTSTLIESFADFAKQKNIDRPTMIRILEDVFRNMIKKKYVSDENFDVIVNADKGDLEIWRFREIVEDDSEDIWDADKISFFIDDREVYVYQPQTKNENNWPFMQPFYIILNLAIGGNFGGPEVDDAIFPQQFTIDYIKVYQ